ncbi:hypothetical protein RRG08_013155 [Elysia crispata]|uniref:Uncharacterized protein n=1 Tax=Elysia crispata TaxID=231223 RepID=A0AAE1DQ21_9GAST|nr:hypothetical protein RRG08_013155 [Elysia crispata]
MLRRIRATCAPGKSCQLSPLRQVSRYFHPMFSPPKKSIVWVNYFDNDNTKAGHLLELGDDYCARETVTVPRDSPAIPNSQFICASSVQPELRELSTAKFTTCRSTFI